MKPTISFVVTARNDDYGGNWQNRINAFMKVLAYQAERTRLPVELVFSEYNPVEGKGLMAEELVVPENPYFEARFIVIPRSFHEKLPDHDKVPVCEFIGKNIAARRARGEYICATNPDVLYSDELFDFFASGMLSAKKFYRVNRRDTSLSSVEPGLRPADILATARRSIIKVMYNDHTEYESWKLWLSDLLHGRSPKILFQCPALNAFKKKDSSKIHENAAGDFLLTHRSNWEKVGGYDQRTVGSGVLDGYIMYSLYCRNLEQELLPYPLYHLYHHHKGVKYLASHAQLRKDAEEMLKTRIPYKINPPDWGFPAEDFRIIAR